MSVPASNDASTTASASEAETVRSRRASSCVEAVADQPHVDASKSEANVHHLLDIRSTGEKTERISVISKVKESFTDIFFSYNLFCE